MLHIRLIFFSAGLVILGAGCAQAAAGSTGACILSGSIDFDRLIDETVAAPELLLRRFKKGGGGLSTAIRNVAARDPDSGNALIALVAVGSPAQRAAIGTGLGEAAVLCAASRTETAKHIQRVVTEAGYLDVMKAFENVAGDVTSEGVLSSSAGSAYRTDKSPNPRRNLPHTPAAQGGAVDATPMGLLGSVPTGGAHRSLSGRSTGSAGVGGFVSVSPYR